MRSLITVLLLTLTGLAYADTGVLVARIPSGADDAVVLAVAKQALVNRQWLIQSNTANSVTAFLKNDLVTGTIRIYVDGQALRYEGEGTRTIPGGRNPQATSASTFKTSVPKRWVGYLKRDISLALATIPDVEAKTAAK